GFTSSTGPEAIATPTTLTPLSAYFRCNSLNCGTSVMQGPHHVAQKSTTSMLPLRDPESKLLPFRSCSLRSTIGFRVSLDALQSAAPAPDWAASPAGK